MTIDPYPGGPLVRLIRTLVRGARQLPDQRRTEPLIEEANKGLAGASYEVHASAIRITPDSPLQGIFNGLIGFPGIEIYVHGSWADNSKTPFSDLDDLIIVDTDAVKSAGLVSKLISRLNKVDMRFCRIDPIQHHGHWIIENRDLEKYDESYMPLTVLQGALCLQGRDHISARVMADVTQRGLRRNLEVTLNNILRCHEKYSQGRINLYEMKGYIGSILLTPAYIFQLKGRRISKRSAIENAATLFGHEGLAALACCSSIRRDWGQAITGRHFKTLGFSTHLFSNPHLYRRFAARASPIFPTERFPKLLTHNIEAFVSQSKALADGT